MEEWLCLLKALIQLWANRVCPPAALPRGIWHHLPLPEAGAGFVKLKCAARFAAAPHMKYSETDGRRQQAVGWGLGLGWGGVCQSPNRTTPS